MLIDECFTELDSKQSEMAPKNIKNVRKANTREMQVFSTSVSPEGKKKKKSAVLHLKKNAHL